MLRFINIALILIVSFTSCKKPNTKTNPILTNKIEPLTEFEKKSDNNFSISIEIDTSGNVYLNDVNIFVDSLDILINRLRDKVNSNDKDKLYITLKAYKNTSMRDVSKVKQEIREAEISKINFILQN